MIINQHHTPFGDWCYYSRTVLLSTVCLFIVLNLVVHVELFLARQQREVAYEHWQI